MRFAIVAEGAPNPFASASAAGSAPAAASGGAPRQGSATTGGTAAKKPPIAPAAGGAAGKAGGGAGGAKGGAAGSGSSSASSVTVGPFTLSPAADTVQPGAEAKITVEYTPEVSRWTYPPCPPPTPLHASARLIMGSSLRVAFFVGTRGGF